MNIKRIDEQSAQEIPHVELPESVEHNGGISGKVRAVTTVNAQSTNMISGNRQATNANFLLSNNAQSP